MEAFRHILVPTDFGDSSQAAEDLAVDLAARFGARLTLAHVHDPPVTYGLGYVPLPEMNAAASKALDAAFDRLTARAPASDRIFAVGRPWERIVAMAKEHAFDLIVMGTHGRRGLSRALLGSVAERVVRLSPVPVLTVPDRQRDAPEA